MSIVGLSGIATNYVSSTVWRSYDPATKRSPPPHVGLQWTRYNKRVNKCAGRSMIMI